MPQMFQVLRCYKCSVFQIHQIRKDNKWSCKMCGVKQSVKRHYGLGTGKDCRIHVQKLNKLRGDKIETQKNIDSDDSEYSNTEYCEKNVSNEPLVQINNSKESKWAVFIDEIKEEKNESEYYNDAEVITTLPQKKKLNRNFRNSKCSKQTIRNDMHNEINNISNNIDDTSNVNNDTLVNCISKSPQISPSCRLKSVKTEKVVDKYDNIFQNKSEKNNKLSKWAQFIDNEETTDNISDDKVKLDCKNPLFSLCDDDDIDTILDF